MKEKYFNDAVIGNSNIKASFTKSGEMIRLLYGAADYKQFLDIFHTGIKVNDSQIIYLHEDINNNYSQNYIENTNILETSIFNSYFKINIIQTDFVPVNENILVKKYVLKNENNIDLNINFLVYSKVLTDINNDTSGYVKENALIQYNHDFSVCIFSDKKLLNKQVNNAKDSISSGIICGKDYIGMSNDSAISYDLGVLKPGEKTGLVLYVYINKNKENNLLSELDSQIDRIRRFDVEKMQEDTKEYWRKYLKDHDKLNIAIKNINENIKKIYNRTILYFPLLVNEKTGGISAGIEVDEFRNYCGRYSYCWPRDGVFVTEALDIVGMTDITEKFYSTFCRITQSRNGMWEQRFFTDGRLAPCWGYQVDETASVIFGAYAHYKVCRSITFLKENLRMLEDGISFLEEYIDDLLSNKNNFQKSYDLWEEFEGVSLYSISSIYAAFSSMLSIYKILKEEYKDNFSRLEIIDKQIERISRLTLDVKEYCLNTFYDEERNSFVRNLNDKRIDISIVGSVTPFRMFSPENIKVQNTIKKLNETIRTYTGGYVRYENDSYMGGKNPWPIATLWMAWYYLEIGDNEKALECFNFVVNSATKHGFLGEQVNNEKIEPCWVIGLTWSHAMFIIIFGKLIDKNLI